MSNFRTDRVALFTAALRSGHYPQTTGRLHRRITRRRFLRRSVTIDSYCALGVACQVAIAHGVDVTVTERNGYVTYDGEAYVPPLGFVCWYGKPFSVIRLWQHVWRCNDEGASFTQLADAIDAYVAADAADRAPEATVTIPDAELVPA